MRRQKHPATAHDYSWLYAFPEGTDMAVGAALTGDPALARSGWRLRRCESLDEGRLGRKDDRTIEVELEGSGARLLRLRLLAANYVQEPNVEDGPLERRAPDIAELLAATVLETANSHTAGIEDWLEL